MNYLDDNTLKAIRASQLNKEAFVAMPGGMPEDQGQGGAPPQGGPPQGAAPAGPPQGGPPQGDPSMGGAPMGEPVPQEIIPILQQMGIQVDPQTGMAVDPETGQPIPTEMVMQVLQENGMLGGGDPAMGGPPMGGDPAMGGDPSMGGPAPMPPEPAPAPPEPLLPPDSIAMASKEEFKAIMADVLKRDLPGLLKQELPTLLQPLLKEAVAQVLSGQYQGADEQLLTSIADAVANNNEILNTITGVVG
jgi:hypothetical protein